MADALIARLEARAEAIFKAADKDGSGELSKKV